MRGGAVVGVPAALLAPKVSNPGFAFWPQATEVSTLGVTVTASATIHTVGAWAEIITATSAPATHALIAITGMSASSTDTRGLVNIATGAGGSEVTRIPNLPAGFSGGATQPLVYRFPLAIPKGTRIAANLQALITSDTCAMTITLFNDPTSRAPTTLDTYGADTANSRGTNMPTSNTYVEITSATTQAYRALVVLPCGGAGTSYATESSTYTLATGAGGSEIPVATMIVATTTAENIYADPRSNQAGIAVGHFPKGTRIACKQSTGRNYRDVIVVGVPYA